MDTQSFEVFYQRAVAVVVNPIQSVKAKIVIDAFRLINPRTMRSPGRLLPTLAISTSLLFRYTISIVTFLFKEARSVEAIG